MSDRSRPNACWILGTLVLGTVVTAMIALPAHADDEAGPEDRARLAEALRAAGYDSFEEVELDDGVWEVDDAVGSDGREYDLELDPDTLEITRKEPD
jgi:Peptidase propeptide and YPEB domain